MPSYDARRQSWFYVNYGTDLHPHVADSRDLDATRTAKAAAAADYRRRLDWERKNGWWADDNVIFMGLFLAVPGWWAAGLVVGNAALASDSNPLFALMWAALIFGVVQVLLFYAVYEATSKYIALALDAAVLAVFACIATSL